MPEEEPNQPDAPAESGSAGSRSAGSGSAAAGSGARGLFRRDMERQEQLLSFAAALLAIVLGVVGAVTYKAPVHTAHNAHAVKTVSPGLLLGLACGFGVALWLAARHGSRVLTALVAMALFLTAFSGTVLGFPFVGLGGWLLFRNYKATQDQRAALREQRAAARAQRGGGGGGASTRASREPRPTRRARKEAEAAEAKRIEANKRYTPPAPRRRRPGR